MRQPLLRPAALGGLGLLVFLAAPAPASELPSTRFFLHSATGSYLTDSVGTVPFSAPAGSTMDTTAPTRAASATAMHRGNTNTPGVPTSPTFRWPVSGTVRSVCIDLYVQSTAFAYQPPPPTLDSFIYVTLRFFSGPGVTYQGLTVVYKPTGSGIQRITAHANAAGGAYEVVAGQPLVLGGYGVPNPDWTLFYDSPTHPSSIIPNVPREKCTAALMTAPKAAR